MTNNNLQERIKEIIDGYFESYSVKSTSWVYDEITDLIQEVCESVVPEEEKTNQQYDYEFDIVHGRNACISEIKRNINKLFKNKSS